MEEWLAGHRRDCNGQSRLGGGKSPEDVIVQRDMVGQKLPGNATESGADD